MSVFVRSVSTLALTLAVCAVTPMSVFADGDEQDHSDSDFGAASPAAEANGPDDGAAPSNGPSVTSTTPAITAPAVPGTTTVSIPGVINSTLATNTTTTTTTTTTTATTTNSIVASINSATGYCKQVQPSAYTVDCLSERLGQLAKELEGQEGFEQIQEVLEDTSAKLNKVARQNRSSNRAAARFTTPGQKTEETSRRLIPVDESKQDLAVAQALEVLDQAQTLLLRSAGDTGSQAIQFQRIASALGSNKVLLRSI